MIDFNKRLFLDGGMGSLVMERGHLSVGYVMEKLNYENPELIKAIHNDYLKAGSDIIYTNTFGANKYKFDYINLCKVIKSGIKIAEECASVYGKYVALDIGPLGKLIGEGGISFDEAYEAFKQIVIIANDTTDCIVIETMTNLVEARIATLAVKENSKLPVMVSMAIQTNFRSFFGNPIECFCDIIGGLGVDAIGLNCSVGPKEMAPLAKLLARSTDKPIFVKPNAGMPTLLNGETVYHISAGEFAKYMAEMAEYGINIFGGCCGTTPQFIIETKNKIDKIAPVRFEYTSVSSISSALKRVVADTPLIVGERINPTGKKVFQQALREENWSYILGQALEQEESGADILDVNVGLNGIDEVACMRKAVEKLQSVTTLPLQIDSTNLEAMEAGLRYYNGKAIINSVNGKEESLKAVLPLAKKYGSAVIGLTIDEEGISADINKRVAIAKKIIERCHSYGIKNQDIYIDTLTMAEASQQGNALCTLGTLKVIKALGVRTVLGISNISFGMPSRMDINAKFMELALNNGLDLCIINPNLKNMTGSKEAEDFLLAKENSANIYIEYATKAEAVIEKSLVTTQKTLYEAVVSGQKDFAYEITKKLLETEQPLEIVNKYLIPALDTVGDSYEKGVIFLPQLIASADAAKSAFALIDKVLPQKSDGDEKKVVLATVKGDIHDIGKNIVKAVISNYGFKVIDLGKDVDYLEVLQAVEKNFPCALGLSALMTTTVNNMEATIKMVKEKFNISVFVGGAVLTPEYAQAIGGIYCKDANDTVKQLKKYFKQN